MNNIPEKIYLREVDLVEVGNCLSENNDKTDIEYTRTDVLIDKATEYLQEHLIDYWYQCVTDESKFIEEFKKAME